MIQIATEPMTVETDTVYLNAEDKHKIQCHIWYNADPANARGVIHILHGMAEHMMRYDEFARALCEAGFIVYAHNHRGHGEQLEKHQFGFFAQTNGWALVQDDVRVVHNEIHRAHPNKPLIIFSHSMGSYIAGHYLITHGDQLNGAILSGTNYSPPWLYQLASIPIKLERLRVGAKGASKLIDTLTFGQYNRVFKPNRTSFDWLSRDEKEVDRYIDDPLCGFDTTTQLWLDLFEGLAFSSKTENLMAIPDSLPIYVFGGGDDPTNNKTGLNKLAAKLRESGCVDVQCRVYEGGRHEMLNEINKAEVYGHVTQWLNQRF